MTIPMHERDIVEQLRDHQWMKDNPHITGRRAADEIERLHAECQEGYDKTLKASAMDLTAVRINTIEECAEVAENFPARSHGALATAPYAAAEQAADEIAAAIRALAEAGERKS